MIESHRKPEINQNLRKITPKKKHVEPPPNVLVVNHAPFPHFHHPRRQLGAPEFPPLAATLASASFTAASEAGGIRAPSG